ncbi:DUF4249 domain-containing protein [Pedobacter planticolens]|uniref:DUF4249 domain-containing protein n=1 Tax=Pedobacter planticolens TaxID=2679964 RepID=UPI001602CECF|nr:DUF4249 domain-containing protein [Pedobacter planticolens]
MKQFKVIYIVIIALIITSCKEPYAPNLTKTNNNLLVIEGFINTGADSTLINLSKTVLVDNKNTASPELNATVTVESDANNTYLLKDIGKGLYVSAGLNLDNSKKYRLRIKTSKGTVYISDFVEPKVAPPIDDVVWDIKDDGVQIYVNTHDNTNNSKYYRWEYNDTWEFQAEYYSMYISNGKDVVDRNQLTDNIFTCWAGGKSSNVLIGSSIKSEKDIIHKSPLTFIPTDAEKISVKYSILVKQMVLTKDAYDFWERLKKNTENLGSIFDAQPSQLTGNVHNAADLSEPVIGYIGAGTTQTKRIFIAKNKLPSWTRKYPYACYPLDSIFIISPKTGSRDEDKFFHTKIMVPIEEIKINNVIVAHKGTTKECGDCTIRGVNKRPTFWD